MLCATSWLTFPNNPSNLSTDDSSGCPGRISHACCSQGEAGTASFVSTLDEPFMVDETIDGSGSVQSHYPIADSARGGTDNSSELHSPPQLSFLQGVLRAICGVSCMMLMLNGALLNGVYNMWQSAFPLLLSNISTEQFAQNQTTAKLEEYVCFEKLSHLCLIVVNVCIWWRSACHVCMSPYFQHFV